MENSSGQKFIKYLLHDQILQVTYQSLFTVELNRSSKILLATN